MATFVAGTGTAGLEDERRAIAQRRSALRFLPYLAFLSIGLCCAFYPMLLSGFRRMEVNTGDTRLQNFFLEHSYRWMKSWLALHPISLWDQPFFFPTRNVGAYSDVLVGSAPIYWVFRLVRFAPDTAFQLWMMVVLTIDFVAMILFLRNCLGFGRLASAAGGFLFAFGSPRLAQLGHQQLLPQFFTVFGLYGLFRFFEPRKVSARQGIHLFFLSFAAQLWAGFYLGWYMFLGALVAALCAICLPGHRRILLQHLWRHRASIAVAGGLFGILVAPMAYHYLSAVRDVGTRPFSDVALMIPRVQSWFYLGSPSWLYSWQSRFKLFQSITYEHEQHLGIGWMTSIFAVAGFYRFHKKYNGWATVGGISAIAIVLLTTLYPGGFTPWKYLFGLIPGAGAIRALSRVALLMLIPSAIGLAFLIEARTGLAAAALIGAVCVLEQGQHLDAYDKFEVRDHVAAIASQVGKSCTAFYYSPVYREKERDTPLEYELHIDAMWAALETGVPTLNGYTGNSPTGWGSLWSNKLFDGAAQIHMRESIERWSSSHGLDPAKVCWIRSP